MKIVMRKVEKDHLVWLERRGYVGKKTDTQEN